MKIEPEKRKVDCPIIDAHMHGNTLMEMAYFVEAMAEYNITKAVAISDIETGDYLKEKYDGLFDIAVRLDYSVLDKPDLFIKTNLDMLDEAAEKGAVAVKYWFKPEFNASAGMCLDDKRLNRIFRKMAEHQLPGIVHIADPDIWFDKYYQDTQVYGTKADQFVQIENVLDQHPDVKIVGAHFGADPEHLDHLADLLDKYSNYFIDTSATKWVVRELGKKPEEARAFIEQYCDRILFGTDNVVRKAQEVQVYSLRFWIHLKFWETDIRTASPLPDADADGESQIIGLDLSPEILKKIYYKNALKVFPHLKIDAGDNGPD
jgi:predicted TIM-barrel fold metal-dependent hydrolase